jgi:hypothetical protein
MTRIVLYMTVDGEQVALVTKFAVPPAVGTTVRVLPPGCEYPIRHKVEQVIADPFDGNYYIMLQNRGSERSSPQAAKFSQTLQSWGWQKV